MYDYTHSRLPEGITTGICEQLMLCEEEGQRALSFPLCGVVGREIDARKRGGRREGPL